MTEHESPKPVFWIASSQKELRQFPEEVRRIFGFAIWKAQNGEKHPDEKPLKGFGGAGVLEVRAELRRNAYRAVYTGEFKDAVYVLHVFEKKSAKGIKTRTADLDLIQSRLRIAKDHYEKWRRSQEQREAGRN